MIVSSVREMLSDIPPNLAEDVVRGKIRLAGGGALLPGLSSRIEVATGIPVLVVVTTRCGASSGERPRFSSTAGGPQPPGSPERGGRPGTGGGEAAPLLPPAAPARLALVQERPHPFPRVRQLAGRGHHLDGIGVGLRLVEVDLRVQGLLADALALRGPPRDALQQVGDRGVQLPGRAPPG